MSLLTARRNAGLSQVEVAKKLGITDAAVSMWENGKTYPRTAFLSKLAQIYGCTVDEMLADQSTQDVDRPST